MKRLVVLGMLGMAGVVVACGSGAQGPTGQAGPAGMNGTDGTNGEAGLSGSPATPSVSGITPPQAFLARTVELTISGYGTNWSSTTTVDFGGTDIAVNKITVASPTALVVSATTSKSATLGPRDITVKDGTNTETYKGAFQVLAPVTVTYEGNVAQGGNFFANIKVLDLSTPLDTTTDATGAFSNIAVTAPAGVTALVQTVGDYTAQLEIQVDVNAMTGAQTFDLVSGPVGATTNIDFPAPKALNIASVTPTVLTAGTAVSGTTAAAFDTSVFSFTPSSAAQTILDFGISTTSATATPALLLLSDGKWADFVTGAQAQSGAPGAFSYVSTQATPFYGITWDNSGATGPFSLAGLVSTPVASTAAATANDATAATAIVATTFPFVLTGGDLSNSAGAGDWVKVKLPTGKTSVRVQASGDLNTDSIVAVTTDGSTTAGTTADQTETGTIVDATFTGLTAGTTYYVTFTQGSGNFQATDTTYTGIIRAL